MYNITIRFYEELNDFLPMDWRKRDIDFSFAGRRSIKDLIESMGVPHTEVDLILVNGQSVDFGYIIKNFDRISVYPVFESISINDITHLREYPLREIKFVLDVHLRKLARRLRLLGFDVDYKDGRNDPELAEISHRENKILLTRDRQLLMRKIVDRGIIIRNTDPRTQIDEVLDRLDLWSLCRPFTRCIQCNGMIKAVNPESDDFSRIKARIPEGVLKWCNEYFICGSCGNVYWKGSHFQKLMSFVDDILKNDKS